MKSWSQQLCVKKIMVQTRISITNHSEAQIDIKEGDAACCLEWLESNFLQ